MDLKEAHEKRPAAATTTANKPASFDNGKRAGKIISRRLVSAARIPFRFDLIRFVSFRFVFDVLARFGLCFIANWPKSTRARARAHTQTRARTNQCLCNATLAPWQIKPERAHKTRGPKSNKLQSARRSRAAPRRRARSS